MKTVQKILFLLVGFGIFILLAYLSYQTNSGIPFFAFFGVMIVLSIILSIFYLKRVKKEMNRQENMSEETIQEDINQTRNKVKYDAYQVKTVVDNWKQSTKLDKIKSILFVSFFLACIIGTFVFFSLNYIVYGLICFGLGAGEIIVALIVVKLLERRSLSLEENIEEKKLTAEVLFSTISSQTTTGSNDHKSIRKTIYKITLRISQDETGIAYSNTPYEIGDKVIIQRHPKKPQIIHIIKKEESIFDFDENEF